MVVREPEAPDPPVATWSPTGSKFGAQRAPIGPNGADEGPTDPNGPFATVGLEVPVAFTGGVP